MNSPWLDLQGPAVLRTIGTTVLRVVSHLRPYAVLRTAPTTQYGASLHTSGRGALPFDLTLKPLQAFPVTVGWLAAIRRGHARLHRGIEVGVPVLVLHSDRSVAEATATPDEIDNADAILDVGQIARWSAALGTDVSDVCVPGGRHDVFLSADTARATAYARLSAWLTSRLGVTGRSARR